MTTPFQVVLPQIIVEAALTAGQPVSGAGTMTLNDATFGKLDTDFLAGADAWTDITPWMLGFSVTRPSSRLAGPLFQFQPGTCLVTLDNSDGRFDPDNLTGPYVAAGVSQVHAMVPLRIHAIWNGTDYPLSRTFADSWTETAVDYDAGYSEWTVASTDGFKILSGITLPTVGAAGGGEDTGARVNRILNAASWYTGQGAGSRVVDTGDSTLQAYTGGDTPLNLLQVATDSEIGQLYVNGAGGVVFRHRRALLTDTRSNTSQATFGDNPTGTSELACAAISRADDDTTIANDIQATRVGGGAVMQEVTDATSIATYLFPRSYARSDLLLQDDPTVLQWANWVLYVAKTGEDRFDTVTVDPAADPVNLWPQVLGRDIGDRITIIRRPQNSGITITRDVFITGITHAFDTRTSAWSTTWTLADASKYGSFLTLDNSILGKLNSNALAY